MALKYLDETGLAYLWGKLKSTFQEKLVSGTNIKTINNTSLLGSGNITTMTPLSAYPVGSVYISTNSTSPATLFGGTWVQIKGRFLLGTGAPDNNTNTYWGTNLTYDGTNKYNENVKSTGGESMHTLIEWEMPSHTHKVSSGWQSSGTTDRITYGSVSGDYYNSGYGNVQFINNTGGDGMHNNMPPYFAVYMWERTA